MGKNACISTTLESHNSLLAELQEDIEIRSKNLNKDAVWNKIYVIVLFCWKEDGVNIEMRMVSVVRDEAMLVRARFALLKSAQHSRHTTTFETAWTT